MYELFYKFREKPFSLFPDHRFLFLNRRYKLALSLLEFGLLNKNGMILLTGDPGSGKTTLIQKILADLDETVMVGQLAFTYGKESSLLPWVLKAFALDSPSAQPTDLFQSLEEFFLNAYREKKTILLIVDEAQSLALEKLEELRLLFNLNDRTGAVFQILLAGHTQLKKRLQDPQYSAFVQRIGTDFSLDPLSQEDTLAYVRHRVLLAGGSASLFSEKACEKIFRYTGGTPRLINQLCETCLIYGFSDQVSRITEALVSEAAKDRLHGGILPLAQDSRDGSLDTQEKKEPLRDDDSLRQQATALDSGDSSNQLDVDHEEGLVAQGELRPTYTQSLPILKPRQNPNPTKVNLVTNPEKHWEEGLKLRDEGWCIEAIQSFKLAATHSQYRTTGWFQVAQCNLVLGRKQEALRALRICLNNSSSSADQLARIQYATGELLEDLGEIEESLQYYQLARSTDPMFDPQKSKSPNIVDVHGSTTGAETQQQQSTSWFIRCLKRILFLD